MIRRPPAPRASRAHAVTSSTKRAAGPGDISATRSWFSCVVMRRQPSFSPATRIDAGTRTASKYVALVRLPPRVWIGVSEKPGDFTSTIKIEMPLCLGASGSVRTASQMKSAYSARLVNTFWPVTT